MAAQQFCNFLVENGLVDRNTLPSVPVELIDQKVQPMSTFPPTANFGQPDMPQRTDRPLPSNLPYARRPQTPPIPPPLFQDSQPGPSWAGNQGAPRPQSYGGECMWTDTATQLCHKLSPHLTACTRHIS